MMVYPTIIQLFIIPVRNQARPIPVCSHNTNIDLPRCQDLTFPPTSSKIIEHLQSSQSNFLNYLDKLRNKF